jgi:hypothetical protein
LEAYTQALNEAPGYALLYLLRAEAWVGVGKIQDGEQAGAANLNALADLNAAVTSPQAEQLEPTIQKAQLGQLSCANLLS